MSHITTSGAEILAVQAMFTHRHALHRLARKIRVPVAFTAATQELDAAMKFQMLHTRHIVSENCATLRDHCQKNHLTQVHSCCLNQTAPDLPAHLFQSELRTVQTCWRLAKTVPA